MATRDQLYAKFGVTAEAAQLLETELGTLLMCGRAFENGWHIVSDQLRAKSSFDEITLSTLGRLLTDLRKCMRFEDELEPMLKSALKARNRLMHGFYERHNNKIQTDEGRDEMIADLELLHDELFHAWKVAGAMAQNTLNIMLKQQALALGVLDAEEAPLR